MRGWVLHAVVAVLVCFAGPRVVRAGVIQCESPDGDQEVAQRGLEIDMEAATATILQGWEESWDEPEIAAALPSGEVLPLEIDMQFDSYRLIANISDFVSGSGALRTGVFLEL